MKIFQFFIFLFFCNADEIDKELKTLIKDLESELSRSTRSEGGQIQGRSNSREKVQTRKISSDDPHTTYLLQDGVPLTTPGGL